MHTPYNFIIIISLSRSGPLRALARAFQLVGQPSFSVLPFFYPQNPKLKSLGSIRGRCVTICIYMCTRIEQRLIVVCGHPGFYVSVVAVD